MTTGQLIQFAAEKVGMIAQQVENSDEWILIDYKVAGVTNVVTAYNLSSPDLMLKGMEVLCRSGCKWKHTPYTWEMWKTGYPTRYAKQMFIHIKETPLNFWQCWYQLEKG